MAFGSRAMTPEAIDRALAGYTPRVYGAAELRRAAILVPLRRTHDGDVEVVYTMRPETMRQHGGQPAFPGGGLEPVDAGPRDAALRETVEELGVPPEALRVIGRLDDLPTVTRFHVTAWVGWLAPDAILRPSPEEVAAVFSVRLSDLADPAQRRTMGGRWRDRPARLHFFLGGDHVIWGASAHITHNLLSVLDI